MPDGMAKKRRVKVINFESCTGDGGNSSDSIFDAVTSTTIFPLRIPEVSEICIFSEGV
jgi:hypothetical protein